MYFKILATIALAAFVMTGCSGVDPLSAPSEETADTGGGQPIGIAPGEPHPDAFVNLKDWLQTDLAADLNGDGEIGEDDFRLFLAATSPLVEPGDEPVIAPPSRLPDSSPASWVVNPALFVTGDLEEAERLAEFLADADLQAMVENIDFDHNWLLVAFRGQVSTAGYGVTIEGVEYDGRSVRVDISLSDPPPGDMVAQVISSPFASVVVSRESVPVEEPTTWLMSTEDGALQARLQYPYDNGATSGAAVPGSDGRTEPGVVVVDPIAPRGEPDGDDEPTATPKVDIRGTVTKISVPQDANEEIVAVILIEGQVEEDTNVDKAWLTITLGTFVGFVDGDEFIKVPFSEIKPGQTVEAIFAGPVAESYPVQAHARALLILRD